KRRLHAPAPAARAETELRRRCLALVDLESVDQEGPARALDARSRGRGATALNALPKVFLVESHQTEKTGISRIRRTIVYLNCSTLQVAAKDRTLEAEGSIPFSSTERSLRYERAQRKKGRRIADNAGLSCAAHPALDSNW